MRPVSFIGYLVATLMLLACGNGGDGSVDAADNGTPDGGGMVADAAPGTPDASPGAPDAEPACSTLQNTAPVGDGGTSTAPRPPATGGTIQDGTYHLLSDTRYGQPQTMRLGDVQGTAIIVGNRLEWIVSINNSNAEPQVEMFETSGNTIVITQVCPVEGLTSSWTEYTYSDERLHLHLPMVNEVVLNRVQTWVRQP